MDSNRVTRLAFALPLVFCLLACQPSTSNAPESATLETSSSPLAASTEAPASPNWQRLPAPTDLPEDRPLQVGFLVVDGVYNSELIAPYDIFHHTVFHTQPGMEVFTVSPDGQPITTFEGLQITVHHSFESAPEIDILVVPSAEHSMDTDLENETMITWVRKVGGAARFTMSLCDGAFVLAQAGLLDGRSVTTFPGDQDAFAERFPNLDLRRGVSFVHDRRLITSEGGAKSYDPALYLVDHLYGEQVATGVGRGMAWHWPTKAATVTALVVAADRSD